MPGNEVGDRVHNFFDQGSLSQDHRHSQFVASNWPGYNANIWNTSDRQIGGTVNMGPEHYNSQQSDIERGQVHQSSLGPNGLNLARTNVRTEFVKNPSQIPQLNLNGFIHASQVGHTRQNEANFLGVDTEPNRRNITPKNPILESQQRSGSLLPNSSSFGNSESQMNFNFLGGQHQMNGQQAILMQSLGPGSNNTQLQQQYILKQMELQRQHQLQQFEAIQRSAAGQVSPFQNETAGQHPPSINGNPLRDTSNCSWPSQATASNMNWQQRELSSSMQGYSNGFLISPEQGQGMQFLGLIPQQTSQSLYGIPVSSSRNSNAFSHVNVDNPGMLQVPAPTSSFSGNQYGTHAQQAGVKEGNMMSRYESEGKTSFEQPSSQGLGNMINLGGFTQVQQRNTLMVEASGQGFAGGTELVTEKSVTQASLQTASTQAAVGLDPTEEKILFGSDDNIWEAFGGASLAGSGDASDLLNGFPSMQSGTWSALMQSAVAETSSTDGGVQEEWSGIGSQSSRPQSGSQHPSSFLSNEKSQHNMVDSSQRASIGSQLSNNDVNFHNAHSDPNVNYANSSMQQQQFSNQRREEIQTKSQITQEGRRWLDCQQQKPHVEEKRGVANSNSSRDFSRTDSGLWGHQQSSFFPNNAHQSSQPSPSNFIGSVPANGSIAFSNQGYLFDKDRDMQMGMDTGRDAITRLEPVPNSNIKIGKDNVGAPDMSSMKVNLESSQNLPDNHHDLWRSVNSSRKTGFKGTGGDQHNLNKGPPILESSNNSLDDGTAEFHEAENGERRENSSDSHRSNFPSNASVGNLREDQRSLPGGKEKSSGQAGKRGSVTQKFQHHPMGDVDVNLDSSYAAKQVLHSHPISQHLSAGVQGQESNLKFLAPLSTNITDMEGRLSNYHGPVNVSRGVSPGGAHPGYLPFMPATFVKSGEHSSPKQHMSPSQNMLELLHKVDQSKEQNAASHLSSSGYNRLSDAPVGGVAGPSQSHLSTSHGFSLQLARPSQGISPPNLGDAVQSSSRSAGSPSTGHVASEIGDKTHSWLSSVSSAQCLPPSHQPTQMDSGLGPDRLGNMDANVSVHNLKDKHSVSSIKSVPQSEQSATVAFDRQRYHDQQLNDSQPRAVSCRLVANSQGNLVAGIDMNQPGMQALMRQMPNSFNAVMSGMSRKDTLSHVGNLWASQQHLLGSQASDLLKSQFQSPNALKTSFTQQKRDEQDDPERVDALSSQGMVGGVETQTAEALSSAKVAGTSQEEPSVTHQPEASPSCPAINKKDYDLSNENNAAHINHSLLHQTQAMKNIGSDPSHRESKRFKGEDDGLKQIAGQVVAPITNSMARDLPMSHISAGDAMILKFSPQLGNRNTFQLPHGTVTSQDMLSFGCGDPQKFAAGNITSRTNLTGISPQMAPSWFEQYGTFKNGQLSSVHNVTRVPMKNVEQQIISGNPPNNLHQHNSVQLAASDGTEAGQFGNTCQTANAYTGSDHISSLHSLVPDVSAPISASMRPKKRKTATSDLLSWNKEIGLCIKRLQNLSSTEMDWARASNRLVEKVEDETDNSEDLLSMTRIRRRLLLTTQLVQQVFRPPSAAVLSLDASSNYEVIVYSLARSVLGDACSLTCGLESNSPVESANSLNGKVKTSERIQDQYFSKVVEDFVSRGKELENELLRLDKRASVLDFRLECQDLERFSVINRFARFHGRGQVDGVETSSSSDANATIQKPCPQRYVSAHSMPRNVPERVQCLSL